MNVTHTRVSYLHLCKILDLDNTNLLPYGDSEYPTLPTPALNIWRGNAPYMLTLKQIHTIHGAEAQTHALSTHSNSVNE